MNKFLIIIDGPMGSGKSTIGNLLHKELKRTAILNIDSIKWFISDFERGERDNAISYAVLMQMCKEYIKHGINILLTQRFKREESAEPYIKMAEENGLKVFVYHLEAPTEVLINRVDSRPMNALAKTPVPKERVLKNIKDWEENRYQIGKIFNTQELTPEQVVKFILEDIK